ncbi:unnamed protein product [Arctogadus glacialis]
MGKSGAAGELTTVGIQAISSYCICREREQGLRLGACRHDHAEAARQKTHRRPSLRTIQPGGGVCLMKFICVPLKSRTPNWLLRVRAPNWLLRVRAPNWLLRVRAPNWLLRVRAPNWLLRVRAPNWLLRVRAPNNAHLQRRGKQG